MKPKLLVSFSGGRTSAMMLYLIWFNWRDLYDIVVVYANTGKEVEGTLLFVKQVADRWGIPIVWVEYWPASPKGYSVDAAVVTFETASRDGEPFERMIAKLGIPSAAVPICSRILKRETIKSYLRKINWTGYYTAIGIRADEDRVSKHWKTDRVIYPLRSEGGDWPNFGDYDREDTLEWWAQEEFDLDIHDDEGNCDNCWKKNFNKLTRNALRKPKSYDWWRLMETKYENYVPRDNGAKPPFRFYRLNTSVDTLFFLAEHAPKHVVDAMEAQRAKEGCSESCEAFGNDDNLDYLFNEDYDKKI